MGKKTSQELPDPVLLVTKIEANELLNERIDIGKVMLNSKISSQSNLDEERKKYFNWSKYNSQLLTKLFSNNKISNEYTYWGGIMVIGPSNLGKEITEHFDDIKEKIHRIESIIERLDLFEEDKSINHNFKQTKVNDEENKVFIIHGHDETRLLELEKIIRDDFNLIPIILKDQPDQGATTIIEKFELYAPQCSYAIALFTPDDIVENSGKKYLQARPNVIYELGWFCAKLTRKRVILIFNTDFRSLLKSHSFYLI